jgi:hypothetical protein
MGSPGNSCAVEVQVQERGRRASRRSKRICTNLTAKTGDAIQSVQSREHKGCREGDHDTGCPLDGQARADNDVFLGAGRERPPDKRRG